MTDFMYTANSGGSGVMGFWIGRDRKLTAVRGSPFAAGMDATSLTLDRSGRHLYTGTWNDGIFAYSLDSRSGTLRPVRGSPFKTGEGPTTIAISADDQYAYAANVNGENVTGYRIDAASGALKPLPWSPFSFPDTPYRIALNQKRNLAYVVSRGSLWTFD
ncbi:MAG TPA: beta-propeller fold lactonase family protein, partial [Candidatus Cybelea sp.]|nr:beta-propeller fold lactonase family protein [Candidatus Cybelea sp.]